MVNAEQEGDSIVTYYSYPQKVTFYREVSVFLDLLITNEVIHTR